MKTKGCLVTLRPTSLPWRARFTAAFTRLDLLFLVLALGLFAGTVLPLLANTKPRAEQLTCMNNLRQIGQAVTTWASTHQNMNPWWVKQSDDGLSPNSGTMNAAAWIFLLYLKNYYDSPKVLVCPSDTKILANNWDRTADGFATYQDNAVSYFIGLHSYFDYPSSILSGDRNIQASYYPVNCSAGVNNAYALMPNDPQVQWRNSIHRQQGNLLFNSGVVQPVFNAGLSNAIRSSIPTDNTALHMLIP